MPQYACADLVAHWDFNQSTPYGVAVDTRAGLAPRLLGGAAVTADGAGRSGSVGDRAMKFGTAAQRLFLADASYFTAAAAGNVLSVSFWIRQNTVRPSTPVSFIAPSVGGRGFQAHTPWVDGTIYFDTGGCCTGGVHRTFVNPGADWTAWHHVALVKNGDIKDIYLDGVPLISDTNVAPISVAFTELFIGNGPPLGEAVDGDMDDFAVYSHALSATDALALATGTGPASLPGVSLTDSEPDGLPDMWELRMAGNLTTLTGRAADSDSDGLDNATELARGLNPTVADMDSDGLLDGVETNTGVWVSAADRGTNPQNADTDGDGLFDGVESNTGIFVNNSNTGSNPLTRDYDGDLVEDGIEVAYGSNPVNSASTPITPGVPTLLAWWQFNNDSNPALSRDTRAGHIGTILGAAGYSPDAEGSTGLAGDKALRVTGGGGKMYLANASWTNIATRRDQLTVTFWQKLTSPGNSSFWFTSPSASGGGRGFQAHCPWFDSNIYYDSAGCCAAGERLSGPIANDSLWHHYVFLKDGASKRVYIDGVLLLSGTGSAPLQQDFTALTVACDQGATSVIGWLDEFAIFAAPLSDQDITDLFTRAKTPLGIGTSPDSDGDGLPDTWENLYFPSDLTKLGAAPAEFDADGSTDARELVQDTRPNDPDTDADTLLDGVETGTGTWVSASDRGTNPKKTDTDNDLLRDNVETNTGAYNSPADTGTNPNVADTDGDTFRDGYEVPYGSNPTSAASIPFSPGQSFQLALWDFNNASDPASANDVIAQIHGATTGNYSLGGGRSGSPVDHAMCFSPDQAVTVDAGFMNLAAPGDAITISYWQKLNSIRQSSAFWVTSPNPLNGNRGIQAHTPWSDGNMYFDHTGCCDPNVHRISGPLPAIDPQEWHHFALLKNGNTKQIYVDGILVVDGFSGLPLANDLATLTIGGGPAGYTDGCIDDFAVFAGGLTHQQICRLTAGETPRTVLQPAPGGPFEVTAVQLLPAGQIRLTWNSTPGCTYRVEMSDSLAAGSWSGLAAGIPSGGNSTIATLDLPPGLSRILLRVTIQ